MENPTQPTPPADTGVPPPATGSVTEPLHAYLTRNIANGVIDFRLRAQLTPGGDVGFYIHPAHVSGDTRDYIIGGDIEAGEGWDFLFNAQRVPEPDVEAFRKQLRASSQNTEMSRERSSSGPASG